MSIESREIFRQLLLQKRQESKKKLKPKVLPKWIIPSAYSRQYKKIMNTFLNKYINVTNNIIIPRLEYWKKETEQIHKDIARSENILIQNNPIAIIYAVKKDNWVEELESIDENEYSPIFEKEKNKLSTSLLGLITLISKFNKQQWIKINKQQFGFDIFNYENWEKPMLDVWVRRNVNLIKRLTDFYYSQIKETIISNYNTGLTIKDLKEKLLKVNSDFSDYRAEFIARDQINKINNQLSEQRMLDVGVETYFWRNSRDERVVGNPNGLYPVGNPGHGDHWAMEGLLCRIDDPTVYSDDLGRTWKKRTNEMPKTRPGEQYGCRCFEEPNFRPLIEKINVIQENIIG